MKTCIQSDLNLTMKLEKISRKNSIEKILNKDNFIEKDKIFSNEEIIKKESIIKQSSLEFNKKASLFILIINFFKNIYFWKSKKNTLIFACFISILIKSPIFFIFLSLIVLTLKTNEIAKNILDYDIYFNSQSEIDEKVKKNLLILSKYIKIATNLLRKIIVFKKIFMNYSINIFPIKIKVN